MHGIGGDDAGVDPRQALADVARLRARTRRDSHGWWFPLVLFGALVLAAAPLYWGGQPPQDGSITDPFSIALVMAFAGVVTAQPISLAVHWSIALVAGFVGSGLWYRRHTRRVGLRRPVTAFVLTGLVVMVGLLVLQSVPVVGLALFYVSFRGTSAVTVIAVSLFVLARLERSRALLVFAVGFLGVAVLVGTYDVENLIEEAGVPYGDWGPATPVLVAGTVLLAGGLAGRLTGPRRRAPAWA